MKIIFISYFQPRQVVRVQLIQNFTLLLNLITENSKIKIQNSSYLKVNEESLIYNTSQIKYIIIHYFISIFEMLSETDKYRQMIQKSTKRIMLFPHINNKENKPAFTLKRDIKLPSLHPFRSSQQIENNIPITHKITYQSQKYPTSLQNHWPQSCVGLILCEYYQNNQILYVYGTGILIHRNIVLTNAQNVYCQKLNTQYMNIRFIVNVSGDKCSGIYDIKRVYYAKEYIRQQGYKNYKFAILQLYDNLTDSCGYVGWKAISGTEEDGKYTVYGYINQEGLLNLRQKAIHKKYKKQQLDWQCCPGSGVLIMENANIFYNVGLKYSEFFFYLNDQIRNMINQWIETTQIHLADKTIGAQGCKYLSQSNQTHLITINLYSNLIGAQGCKYLSFANWTHLIAINLSKNNICAQGSKYLSQTNWTHLTTIYLWQNHIGAQGCKYLSQANWTCLLVIILDNNIIDAQGCKYLIQANWTHLTQIYLDYNNTGEQGCKYLSQANWKYLIIIDLWSNNIKDISNRVLLQQSYPNSAISI